MMNPTKKVTGYAYLLYMNGIPVVCMVQGTDKTQALADILQSGRERINPAGVHPATLIPGHHFPEAPEVPLREQPLIDAEEKGWVP